MTARKVKAAPLPLFSPAWVKAEVERIRRARARLVRARRAIQDRREQPRDE